MPVGRVSKSHNLRDINIVMHKIILTFCALCLSLYGFTQPSFAQSDVSSLTAEDINPITPLPADVSRERLSQRIESVRDNADLSEEDRAPLLENLLSAREYLEAAEEQAALATKYRDILANVETTTQTLRAQRDEVEELLEQALPELAEQEVTGASLMRLEQELTTRETTAAALSNNIESLQQRLSDLSVRSSVLSTQQTANRQALNTISNNLSALTLAEESALKESSRKRSIAHRHFREYERIALAAEIPSLQPQIATVELQIVIAKAQLAQENRYITRLQDRTGRRRAAAAANRYQVTQQALTDLKAEQAHPLILKVAEENAAYAKQIVDIFNTDNTTFVTEARIRTLLQKVGRDSLLAEQILKEERIDRKYATILRQLRADIPSLWGIRAEIDARAKARLDVSFQRLIAQDKLNAFGIRRLDIEETFAQFFIDNPTAPELNADQELQLRGLYTAQRSLLEDVIDFADVKSADMAKLTTLQERLITAIDDLTLLLDQRLIWLPSAEPISQDWLRRIAVGAVSVFTPSHLVGAVTDLGQGLLRYIWQTLLILIIAILIMRARVNTTERLTALSSTVGKVREDTLWVTPLTVIASVMRVLPLCLLAVWGGYVLMQSGSSEFSGKFGRCIVLIASLYLALLSLRAWSEDGGLFDLHFGMRSALRARIRRNLLWFASAQSVAIVLMVLCDDYSSEDITAGLGLLGFIIGALSWGILIYRLLAEPRGNKQPTFDADSFIGRRRVQVLLALVLMPVGTTLLAMTGYFATALEIQSRIMLTVALLIGAYIIYGVIHRTVIVSQRRLTLQEAIKRRAKLLQERKDRAAAEERGEMPVPQLDYDSIDIETISRQSTQLLNVIAGIFIIIVAYFLWSDLLPALSNLDQTKLPFNTTYSSDSGELLSKSATLWDLLQAIFGTVITLFAAKNLPGFLDLFVLKQTKISAGSRYAITTILGYAIFMIGFLFVSRQLGIDWSKLNLIIAALGVGIGFGLQEIIANFISGLIILFERPVRIGDYVTIGTQSGTVARIKIRATTLSDLENREILIPNKELITGRVTNWTLTNQTSRLTVSVGIAYGSDTDKARDIIMESVKGVKAILKSPEPQVLFVGFGDSSLNFEVRVFLPTFAIRPSVAHELHTQINKALETAGITIPFPQRDIHIIDGQTAGAPKSQTAPESQAQPKAKPAGKAKSKKNAPKKPKSV